MTSQFDLNYDQNLHVTISGSEQALNTFLQRSESYFGGLSQQNEWPLILVRTIDGEPKAVEPGIQMREQLLKARSQETLTRGVGDPTGSLPGWFVTALPQSVQERIENRAVAANRRSKTPSEEQILSVVANALVIVKAVGCTPDVLTFVGASIPAQCYNYYEFRWDGLSALAFCPNGDLSVYVVTCAVDTKSPKEKNKKGILLCRAKTAKELGKWNKSDLGATCALKDRIEKNQPVGVLVWNTSTAEVTYSLSGQCAV